MLFSMPFPLNRFRAYLFTMPPATPFALYANTNHSDDGYVHSIVVHSGGGVGEDAWGIAPIEDIAARFGAIEFDISHHVHREVVGNYLRNSNDCYQTELDIARKLIMQHRVAHDPARFATPFLPIAAGGRRHICKQDQFVPN